MISVNLSEFDIRNLNEITNGVDIEDFRFFGEMNRLDMSVMGLSIYGGDMDLVECKLENPEYGKVDIVPVDYPVHGKRRTYISDIKDMFESHFDNPPCFVRKTGNEKVVEVTVREPLCGNAYLEHTFQAVE